MHVLPPHPRHTIGSLFSGIGGLELGLEMAGLGPTLWQVERDAFCQTVLAKHWPESTRHDDVTTVGAAQLCPVDVLCGGFPCQDVSSAGKQAGLAGKKSGLWFEFRRIVTELRPRVVVVENVASGARLWLCQVQEDLRELGYRVRAFRLGAEDVGAPHRRQRIFVVAWLGPDWVPPWEAEAAAYAELVRRAIETGPGDSVPLADADGGRQPQPQGFVGQERRRLGDGGESLADSASSGRERSDGALDMAGEWWALQLTVERSAARADGREAQPCVGREPDGVPARLDRRWPAGRGEAQHAWEPPRTAPEVPNRPARLRALGNAVVPQCSQVIGYMVRELLTICP